MTSRKRKSLSSILKSQASPSRLALTDLNPNLNAPTDDTTHFDVEQKKKRRSSRRVSFAETYQVKEFDKDSQRKELGLWDDSVDGTSNQEGSLQQAGSSSVGRDTGTGGSGTGGTCLGPGPSHEITGLETLLSGPIKQEARSMTSAAMQGSIDPMSSMQTVTQSDSKNTVEMLGATMEERGHKSSFLKSFLASDPMEAQGQEEGSSWRDAAPATNPSDKKAQPNCQDDTSFKSSFLQAFLAAESSSAPAAPSQSRLEEATWVFGKEEAGMELTACLGPVDAPAGKSAKEEKMGEITRIFGGQEGEINGNGMDMTTCVGGYNTAHFQRELKQPAAESTRIFHEGDTVNMDLTACLTSGENTQSRAHKTMNTTTFGGGMDFTAVFGKFSESAMARVPDESTGRLLSRVDELLGLKKEGTSEVETTCNGPALTSATDTSHFKRDTTQRSTVLDTIKEMSSSNGSVLNMTSGGRSASIIQTDASRSLGTCPEEVNMDITTGMSVPENVRVKYSKDDQTTIFREDDTAAMEMTCAIGGLMPDGGQVTDKASLSCATVIKEDQTRMFHSDEAAEMEMTCAGSGFLSTHKSGILSSSNLKQQTGEENTSRFHCTGTANIELTSCLGDLPEGLAYQMNQKKASKDRDKQIGNNGEKTCFFSVTDAANMEMTECLGKAVFESQGSVQSLRNAPGQSSVKSSSRFSFGEETRLFRSEAAADMDLTECHTKLQSLKSASLVQSSKSKPSDLDDHTKIYQPNDNCDMELTNAHSKMIPAVHPSSADMVSSGPKQTILSNRQEHLASTRDTRMMTGENTMVFQAGEAADMEMTACLGSLSGMQTRRAQQQNNRTNDDKTMVFQTDEAADMEMTTCVGALPTMQKSSQGKGQPTQKESDGKTNDDKTVVFQTGEAADMEMTTCLGTLSGMQKQSFRAEQPVQQPHDKRTNDDKTMVFQMDEAADMEMTTCIGTSSGMQTRSYGAGQLAQQQFDKRTTGDDRTMVFQTDEAADMEMTTCVGTLPAVNASSRQVGPSSRQTGDGKTSNDDRTIMFQKEASADMEMTTCLGTLPSACTDSNHVQQAARSRNSRSKASEDDDRTVVFQTEEAADMEMTTCVGALPAKQVGKFTGKHSYATSAPPCDDNTRIFQAEDTANMDITACTGLQADAKLATCVATTKDKAMTEDDRTKHFSADHETAGMDITLCVQGATDVPSQDAIAAVHACGNTEKLLTESTIRMDLTEQSSSNTSRIIQFKPQLTAESQRGPPSTSETTHRQCSLDLSAKLNASEEVLEKTSDTYTLSSPTVNQDPEDIDLEENPPLCTKDRSSDTFTFTPKMVETSCREEKSITGEASSTTDGSAAETRPQHEAKGDDRGSSEGNSDADARSESDDSDEGRKLEAPASFSLKESIVLPDWVCAEDEKGILEELPLNNDNTEDLYMVAAKRPRLDESGFSFSHANASLMTADLSQLPTLPRDGPVSISDFLQMFCEMDNLPVAKRSIMCPQKVGQPQTVSELLEDSCIIRPKTDMFEWANSFLAPTIKNLKEAVREQEELYSRDNLPLITELQKADPEKSARILKSVKALHKYCTASTKAKVKQWKLKMISNTKDAMEDSLNHVETKVSKVTDSITNLENTLEEIKSVESDLDEAIAALEADRAPTEEEKVEWLSNSERLESLTSDLREKEEAAGQAERERSEMEAAKSRLQEEASRLAGEREELTRWEAEKGSGRTDPDLEEMRNSVVLAHSFQEWRLQTFDETSYKFSFLQKSIILNVQYEHGEGSALLTNLTFESMLADDASSSARLAHSMFFDSVSIEKLRLLYPKKASLPQMMQHLSELVEQARLLETEVRKMDFWHPVTASNNRLSIKFSSVEAHSMFQVHLDLLPGQYPFAPVPHSCTVRIGKISEESINAALDGVQPGWMYVTRLGAAMKSLIKNHSS